MEYLENKLNQRYANLCTKLIMLKKIKEDSITNGEVYLVHSGKPNSVKLPVLLKLIYEFNLIPIKISVCFFLGRNFQGNSKIHSQTRNAYSNQSKCEK